MIRRAMAAFAGALIGAVAPAAGQEQEAAPPARSGEITNGEMTEEIVVTGSRVKRRDLTTPAPVTVVSRDEITASGYTNVGEFLQQLPEQGNALSRQWNNGGDGSTRVNLRSLGDYRTLVLLNGRRYVPAGMGADRAVDLNTIPTAAVERVEILKDGASPMYGSDAMGGVVNIITRKRWDGVDVSAYGGISSRGDAASRVVSLTTGGSGERGSFLLTGSYTDLGPAMAGDRPFSATPYTSNFGNGTVGTTGSPIVPQGSIVLDPWDVGAPNGNDLWNRLMATYPKARRFIRDPSEPNGLGWRPMDRTALSGAGGDLWNYQPDNYLVTPLRLLSLFAIGDRRFGDASRLFFEASYVERRSDQMLAPLPLATGAEGITVSRDNIYNPFGRDFARMQRRLVETDRRRFAEEVDTFRVVGGLDGTLPQALGSISGGSWDVSANYGRSRATTAISGYLTLRGLAHALGPSFIDPGPNGIVDTPLHGTVQGDDVARCGTPGNPIPDCVPVDLFNGPGSITPAMLNQLTYSGTATGANEMLSLQANASAPLFRFWADRPIGFATGYEYRTLFGEYVPDTMSLRGDRRDLKQDITRGSADVHEVYAELSIPVLSGAPMVKDLEIMAAARAFKHQRFEPDWTWKLGGRWKPLADVTLRGTVSTSYRVPSIQELFQGAALTDTDFVNDPCTDLTIDPVSNPGMTSARAAWCRAAGVPAGGTQAIQAAPAPIVGNPRLRPETARVFTTGVVLEPRFARGLSVTIDYWNVHVDHVIAAPSGPWILDACYPSAAGIAPAHCDLVERDPATGQLLGVTNLILNSSGAETAGGVDLSGRYQLPTPIGRIGVALDATWLDHHDLEGFDGKVLHGRGTYDLGLNPEWKYNLGLTWGLGGLGIGGVVRYLSGFKECASEDPILGIVPDACSYSLNGAPVQFSRRVSSWTSLDLFAEYDFGTRMGRTKIGAGVQNVLDTAPPFTNAAFSNNADPSAYGFIGRFFYVRLAQRL